MTNKENELSKGMRWISERFAETLGISPDTLEWEKHSAGALLQVPIAVDTNHYVKFEDSQIEDCAAGTNSQKGMRTWIADHIKTAQRSPSPRKEPHSCKLKV